MNFKRKQDLKPEGFPELTWALNNYEKPLLELCSYSSIQAEKAIDWYYQSRQTRRYFCQLCRLGAILLTALAGILPLINEINLADTDSISRNDNRIINSQPTAISNAAAQEPLPQNRIIQTERLKPRSYFLHPLWSAIAVAIAGSLILIDRFYGFTTGWIRYLLTIQKLTQALDTFRIQQQQHKVSWGKSEPTQEQALALIANVQQFLGQIREIVTDETKSWAADFADALKQIDDQVKIAAQSAQKSALQITVVNGELSTSGWVLIIGDRPPETKFGREASSEIIPGIYIVRVTGNIGDRQVRAEQLVKIIAGEIGRLTLTLS